VYVLFGGGVMYSAIGADGYGTLYFGVMVICLFLLALFLLLVWALIHGRRNVFRKKKTIIIKS
jgi:hypothetical protein